MTKEIEFIDYIKCVLKYKKTIVIIAFIIMLFTGLYVYLILDPIFVSYSTVKTSSKSSGLGGLLSSSIPDIGGLGELGGSSVMKEMALYEGILQSRRCIEEAIIKFKLNDEWKYKYFQDAVKNFRENVLVVSKDKNSGLMEIGINDTDPKRAKELNEFMIDRLNLINLEVNVLNAKNNREFVEKRYNNVRDDLRKAEDSLRYYQDKFGLAPDISVKASAQVEFQLETEIKSEEIKLDILKKMLSHDQPEIKSQEQKIASMQNQLNEIQSSSATDGILKLKGAPEVVLNFYRLTRDVEIQNKILTFIVPLYEQSKIEEKKEMPSVIILDSPTLPEKKSKPKRVVIILISMLSSVVLSSLFFVARDFAIKPLFKKLDNNF